MSVKFALAARPAMVASFATLLWWGIAPGTGPELDVAVAPDTWKVNEPGELAIRITPKGAPLQTGDRVTVSIPGSWVVHAMHRHERNGRRFGNQPYTEMTRELADYLEVVSPVPDARLGLEVAERNADGTYHRFAREVVITVESGTVPVGNPLMLSYGRSDKPIHASFLAETVRFPVRLNNIDAGAPAVTTTSLAAERLVLTGQSTAAVGERVRFHVTSRDRYGNPAPLPPKLSIGGETIETGARGWLDHYVTFDEPGFHRTAVSAGRLGEVQSNPVLVTAGEPPVRLYWGDLHSHTAMSKDGIGETPFVFARDYANLDFYALTEHTSGDRGDPGITDAEWQRIQADVRSFNQPGRFVTLLGYETSFGSPWGHHNVYFDTDAGPLFRTHEIGTLPALWEKLADRTAFTVPHHTGINFGGNPNAKATVWTEDNPLRPLIEIYSGHGQSELFEPASPIAYDNLIFIQRWKQWFQRRAPQTPEEYRQLTGPVSARGPYYARDAWAKGLRLGTIASSDDHTARPGQPEKGLAAVRAPRLDRESIFAALRRRATYATTGERIYLDFHREPNGDLVIEVCGTGPLDWIELVRFDGEYFVARRWSQSQRHFKETMTPEPAEFYYVRLKQANTVGGRPVMAWSSPIRLDAE